MAKAEVCKTSIRRFESARRLREVERPERRSADLQIGTRSAASRAPFTPLTARRLCSVPIWMEIGAPAGAARPPGAQPRHRLCDPHDELPDRWPVSRWGPPDRHQSRFSPTRRRESHRQDRRARPAGAPASVPLGASRSAPEPGSPVARGSGARLPGRVKSESRSFRYASTGSDPRRTRPGGQMDPSRSVTLRGVRLRGGGQVAGMAELVDAGNLKFPAPGGACGFEPRSRHRPGRPTARGASGARERSKMRIRTGAAPLCSGY